LIFGEVLFIQYQATSIQHHATPGSFLALNKEDWLHIFCNARVISVFGLRFCALLPFRRNSLLRLAVERHLKLALCPLYSTSVLFACPGWALFRISDFDTRISGLSGLGRQNAAQRSI
jgi:hypothetical protein